MSVALSPFVATFRNIDFGACPALAEHCGVGDKDLMSENRIFWAFQRMTMVFLDAALIDWCLHTLLIVT
jgi:hypothetical protein